jgi:hypothetical protein
MTIAKFINTTLLWLTLLAFGMQLLIDFSTDNIAVNCIVLTSVLTTLLYFRWSKALDTHPLSSFAVFGFCVTSQLGALLAQSFSWVSISDNLRQPLITFFLLAMYQGIALFCHALYRMLISTSVNNSNKSGLSRSMLGTLGIYATPTVINIWIMGGIGVFSLLLSYVSPVANGLSFLAWTPFLIPLYVQQLGPSYCNAKRNYLFLVAYSALVGLMAMAFNARGMMLTGLATVMLLFLLVGMRSHKAVTTPMLLKFGMIGLLGVALSWPASNMVTAMVIARKDKFKVPLTEMVTKTIDNFLDPEKLAEYNKQIVVKELRSSYDETYIANPMVARFVITKFHDNAIYFSGKISDKGADEVWRISQDYFWATLPQPWLDALKIDVDKDKMYFSMGDVLVNLAVGQPLGGQKTGSIFGQGWVMLGNTFPIVYFFMCLVLFAAIDIFAIRTATGVATLSVIGMIHVWPNFLFGITADSLHQLLNSAVRGVVQSVILYAIVFAIAKLLSNMYLKLSNTNSIVNAELIVEK